MKIYSYYSGWDSVMKIAQNTMYLSYTYIKLECRVSIQMPLSWEVRKGNTLF